MGAAVVVAAPPWRARSVYRRPSALTALCVRSPPRGSHRLQLAFCRDAASLAPVYRSSAEAAYADSADVLGTDLLDRAVLNCVRPADPAQRAAYGRADDMREFAMLVLTCVLLPNAPPEAADIRPGSGSVARLRTLCDGPFAAADDGMPTDGVDVARLREYLEAEEGLRLGGVGGVDVLAVGPKKAGVVTAGSSGWDLLAALLAPDWQQRPSAEEAAKHPFWTAEMFF